MGCSASRSNAIVSRDQLQKQPTNMFSSFSSCSQSPVSALSSTPVSRTLSLPNPIIYHPPLRKGDTDHLVSLTSTTYGSLALIHPPKPSLNVHDFGNPSAKEDVSGDPLSPDSVINTWELMEGLDEVDFESPKKPFLFNNSKTFDNGYVNKDFEAYEMVKSYELFEHCDSKPLWQHLSEESLLAKLDPSVVSSYRKALLAKQFRGKLEAKELSSETNVVRSVESKVLSSSCVDSEVYLSGAEDRIVLYYTSLRGIRRTYEECCAVRMILRGYRVRVDEKDTSMDSSYRKELQSTLGKKTVHLPQVFIKGKYIGGSEEIKQLHEAGVLAKLLQGLPIRDLDLFCQSCGDARFLPCPNCNGSRKIYDKEEEDLRRCQDCNENGLIRCPSCRP